MSHKNDMELVDKFRKYWWIGALVLLILVIVFFASCGGGPTGQPGPSSNGVTTCPSTHTATSAQNICLPKQYAAQQFSQIDRSDGQWIIVEDPLPDDDAFQKPIGDAVVAGLEQTIRSATYHNPTWHNYTSSGQYKVLMIRKQATNMDGTPALITNGVQTAGTVINVWSDGTSRGGEPIIVLPQPDNLEQFKDPAYLSYLKNSARHEGEHVIEYVNAIGVFITKAVEGDIHPHWTLPEEISRGLVARRDPARCLVGADQDARPVAVENGRTVIK